MEQNINELEIRLLVPEDRQKIYDFFRNLGEEGSYFFNRENGNENRTYAFLDGKLKKS